MMVSRSGKARSETARAEVDRAVFTFAVAAEEATRIGGEWLPLDWQSSHRGTSGNRAALSVGADFGNYAV